MHFFPDLRPLWISILSVVSASALVANLRFLPFLTVFQLCPKRKVEAALDQSDCGGGMGNFA